MSAQFGRINFDGKPVDLKEFDRVRRALAPYGPDGEGYICKDSYSAVYRALNLTIADCQQRQPFISAQGNLIIWDGCLDNRDDIVRSSNGLLEINAPDAVIVASVYEREGPSCFARFIGDWAVSVWNPQERSLTLAKDHLGARPLYYLEEDGGVSWSSLLDPLVLFSCNAVTLSEEYIAGWFSSFPAAHLTPFTAIHSVPPSSFVVVKTGRKIIQKYWDFNPDKRVLHRTDEDYEEHFRVAFAAAVKHKLISDSPVVAELSGGIDSSSIVCVADRLIEGGRAITPRLETLSEYNDSEPNWNERPYFEAVEAQRGRVGCHINISLDESLLNKQQFRATPGTSLRRTDRDNQFSEFLIATGAKTVLSGVGGDEVTGGVPTPFPELADRLISGQVFVFARHLTEWALVKRKPWLHLIAGLLQQFIPSGLSLGVCNRQPVPWLAREFAERNWRALSGYRRNWSVLGARPSFQEHLNTIELLRRQLACDTLSCEPCHYRRYPYLDRDFLEFVFGLPPQQLIRPGHRRSLMRRALRGIVPDQILDRKRKAFVSRGPLVSIAAQLPELMRSTHEMICGLAGIVDIGSFRRVLQNARVGDAFPLVPVLRTLTVEDWLRGLELLPAYARTTNRTAAIPISPTSSETRWTLRRFNPTRLSVVKN